MPINTTTKDSETTNKPLKRIKVTKEVNLIRIL